MKAFYSADIEMHLTSNESEGQDDRPLRFMHIPEVSLEKKEISEALGVLRAIFPKTLTADILFANCCWEFAALWHKNPEKIDLLHSALLYLKDVINAELTHGKNFLGYRTD